MSRHRYRIVVYLFLWTYFMGGLVVDGAYRQQHPNRSLAAKYVIVAIWMPLATYAAFRDTIFGEPRP